ncbi:MAG: AAA family ATPase [Nanoarchaeota archaeon]
MTDIFDKILKNGESIFLNDAALDFEFIPSVLLHRENQQAYIGESIRLLEKGRNGINLFIHGHPGIGKTLATRYILRQVEENTDEISTFYINCWKHNTSYKIIVELCNLLNHKFIGDKSTHELINEIKPRLNKKPIVICLDEVDKLENDDVLYFILEEVYKKTLILITNERSWLDELDKRIRSRLYADLLEFKSYNYEETFDILKKRCEYAFYPSVINKTLIEIIAKKSHEIQDIRSGIHLLKESGNLAESRSSKIINEEDVNKAIMKLNEFKIRSSNDISKEKNELLSLVKDNSGKQASEIFKLYDKDISYKTFRRRLEELQNSKLITLENKQNASKGLVTYVYFGLIKNLNEF